MDKTSKKPSRHLWKDKKPVSEILENGSPEEIKTALHVENERLNKVITWLSGAYTTEELIKILNSCGFDENDIVLYGFSKDDILDAIETPDEEIEIE